VIGQSLYNVFMAKFILYRQTELTEPDSAVSAFISDSSESMQVGPKLGELRAERNFRLVVRN